MFRERTRGLVAPLRPLSGGGVAEGSELHHLWPSPNTILTFVHIMCLLRPPVKDAGHFSESGPLTKMLVRPRHS